jgi:hypothetical protein
MTRNSKEIAGWNPEIRMGKTIAIDNIPELLTQLGPVLMESHPQLFRPLYGKPVMVENVSFEGSSREWIVNWSYTGQTGSSFSAKLTDEQFRNVLGLCGKSSDVKNYIAANRVKLELGDEESWERFFEDRE